MNAWSEALKLKQYPLEGTEVFLGRLQGDFLYPPPDSNKWFILPCLITGSAIHESYAEMIVRAKSLDNPLYQRSPQMLLQIERYLAD